MDANGSRFHLLLGRDDWARCSVAGTPLGEVWQASPPKSGAGKLSWKDERHELILEQRLLRYVAAPKDTFPAIENRRGAAGDRYGNWYWIDESEKRIRVLSSGSGQTSDFWPLAQANQCCDGQPKRHGDFQPQAFPDNSAPLQLSGLAVTEDHFLVVGVLAPASLLIFDLHTGGEPRQLVWPVRFAPFDMTAMPGGGVAILDTRRHLGAELDSPNPCYWILDRNFNVLGPKDQETSLAAARADDFQPVAGGDVRGSEASSFPSSVSLFASPIAIKDPVSIEALPDGTVLILDYTPVELESQPDELDESDEEQPVQLFSQIFHYDGARQLPDTLSTSAILSLIENEEKKKVSLVGYDIAFVPQHDEAGETIQDRLYVAAADGNQTFAFHLCLRQGKLELQPIAEYLPMRLFGGKGLVAAGDGAYYDFADTWIPLIKQRRPRYVAEATLETPSFDGVEPNCVWHRLMIDASIPPETSVEVWSRAADEESDLALTQWQPEPPLYLRGDGSELPFLRRTEICKSQSPAKLKDGAGTWELLFQRARGRFLQLCLRFSGNERSTPRVRALRSYYPRFSYVGNYLPGVYREDEQSASFLDRFLANLEGFYTTLEDKIAAAQVLFDVRSAPQDALDWLATWFGVALDPNWDEQRRRLFIKHAMDFFQYRGTIRGLTMALHLALDSCVDEAIFEDGRKGRREDIRIVEKYLTRTMPGVVFGDPSGTDGPRNIVPLARWQPNQGRTNLNQRYTSFKNPSGPADQPLIQYPITAPYVAAEAASWQQFSQDALGFVPRTSAVDQNAWRVFLFSLYGSIAALNAAHETSYSEIGDVALPRDQPQQSKALKDWLDFVNDPESAVTPTGRHLWQDFLARRYRRIKTLNEAYGTHWTGFEVVSLPNELPADGAPLRDWYQFEGIVMQMQRTAHRFTVLLPAPVSLAFTPAEQQLRMDLSRRVVELEKPAHTVFDVKFYWAIFRVGEARLQLDTLIQQGSRAPQLLPRMILGQGFLGGGYLAPPVPEDASNRLILGRDPLRNDPHKEERS